jgi:putative SOS response-associated peptidase YedK
MCFYFGLPATTVKISARYKRPFVSPESFTPTEKFNGFAHPVTPIIANDTPDQITLASWGLVPQWSLDTAFRKNTLNARIETVAQLPSFKDSCHNRCLIPASFFYDWRHEGTQKIPYKVVAQHSELFSFAGIYSDWKEANTSNVIRTYAILTTAANETMQYIHNTKQRMPVILELADEEKWLKGDAIAHYEFPYSVDLVGFAL